MVNGYCARCRHTFMIHVPDGRCGESLPRRCRCSGYLYHREGFWLKSDVPALVLLGLIAILCLLAVERVVR